MFFDENAEYRLLGSLIDNPREALALKEELFTQERRQIYKAMVQSYHTYGDITSEGVERFYGKMLPSEVEASRGSKPVAIVDRLADLATRRQLGAIQENISLYLAQNTQGIDRSYIGKLLTLTPVITKEDSSIMPGITGFISDLQCKKNGLYKFVSTGIPFLDHMLGGEWPRQGLTVLMAQPGAGKTALVGQSMLNMARIGIPTSMISLEMPKHKLVSRFIANMANVDGSKLKKGTIDEEEERRANVAIEELQTLPIYIEDNPEMDINTIIYTIKRHRQEYGIRAFFVDYIQIIDQSIINGCLNDSQILGELTQRLRNLAVQEDISAVVLSQQNRMHKGLNSILGSGRVGQIADTVIELIADQTSTNDDSRSCSLEFHKNRDGPVGSSPVFYRPKYLRFE